MRKTSLASIVSAALIGISTLTIALKPSKTDLSKDAFTPNPIGISSDSVKKSDPKLQYIPTVVIDPGHDIKNKGWQKPRREEELNLEISKLLKDSLMANGYRVILTRESISGLNKRKYVDKDEAKRDEIMMRCNFIDSINPDISIIMHYNANRSSRKPSGTEIFFYGIRSKKQVENGKAERNEPQLCNQYSETSRDIAEKLNEHLLSRGRKSRALGSDFLIFDHDVDKTMIYFEVGYMTNSADYKKWASKEGQIEMVGMMTDFLVKNKDYLVALNESHGRKKDLFYIRPIEKSTLDFMVYDLLKDELTKTSASSSKNISFYEAKDSTQFLR